jgi:tetratricopeptide (TPR) repeat protein
MQVELAFSEVLLQKSTSEYYSAAFANETALAHLNKTVAYFQKKGFTPEADPSVILLYELAGDSVKSQQLFSRIINTPSTTKGTKYQLCKYIINKAAPGSSLLEDAMANMKLLADDAKTDDEKIVTKLELLKGYYALGDNSTAITYALNLSLLLPPKSADYCAVILLFGKIERSEKGYKTALAHYEYVIFFSQDANLKREAFAEKAICYVDSGDVKNALLTYQQYYKDMPDKFTANECAAFYIDHNEHQLAESMLDEALKQDPLFYVTQLNYGDLLVAMDKPKKARPYYVKASNLSGELTEAQQKVIKDYK